MINSAIFNELDERTREVLSRWNTGTVGKDTLSITMKAGDMTTLLQFAQVTLAANDAVTAAVYDELHERLRDVLDRQNRTIIGKDTLMIQVLGRDLMTLVEFAEDTLGCMHEMEDVSDVPRMGS